MKKEIRRLLMIVIALAIIILAGCNKTSATTTTSTKPNVTTTTAGNTQTTLSTTEKQINWDEITDLSVRDFTGENGVVSAANPYAAYAGLQVLEQGGNAFEAAVAVSFALGVCEPNASGVGGGGIMVAFDSSTGEYVCYNMREFVPASGTAKNYGSAEVMDDGILSIGVPTTVAGLMKVLENQPSGNVTRKDVMAPAISYAKDGVIVTPELGNAIRDKFDQIMVSRKETLKVFTSDRISPLEAGELLVQEDYAKVLEEIAEKGNDGFYSGWVADAIVQVMQDKGGFITLEDLAYAAENYPIAETPTQGTYKGFDIVSSSTPSSGGIILVEALNMLEYYQNSTGISLESLGHNSTEYINVMATAMQLAYGDKQKYIGDFKFVDVPVSGLLSKKYAAERWQKYTPGKAYLGKVGPDGVNYGNPIPYNTKVQNLTNYVSDDYQEHFSTTAFSVCDKDGNIVSVTQTINHFFGSGIVPHGCGFFLNNQLSSMSVTSTSVNYVQPYKQPVSHIMPTIVLKDGEAWATLGSPGSMRIPSAVLQTLINLIDFDMDMQEAINAKRVYCYASLGTDDYSSVEEGKHIFTEGLSEEEIAALTAIGYKVTNYEKINLYFGGVHGIRFYSEEGYMQGGADPRRDGKALGY